MPITNRIHNISAEAKKWRRFLHKNPELAFHETKTSAFVQEKLQSFGIPYHTGYGGTGVVGVLKNGTSHKTIGLRADMDALPMQEKNDCEWVSETDGKMHSCGHDGHTAILLATAQYLAETKNFDGTVYFYFQPAEESGGGANIMIQDGLFKDFKPDYVYALHNTPGIAIGQIAVPTGAILAAADTFDITIHGQGGHAAEPNYCKDSVLIASQLNIALQTIISRNVSPFDNAVLTVAKIISGDSHNIIPDTAFLSGTVRTMNQTTRELVIKRIKEIIHGMEILHDVKIDLQYTTGYPVTYNDPSATAIALDAAVAAVGTQNIAENIPSMSTEDFSYMTQHARGCMVFTGNGDSYPAHHPKFDFNDDGIAPAVQWFTNLAEKILHK